MSVHWKFNEWQENLIALGVGIMFALIQVFLEAYGYWFNALAGYLTYAGIDYSVWIGPILSFFLIVLSFYYGRSAKAKVAGTVGLILFVLSLPMLAAPYLP